MKNRCSCNIDTECGAWEQCIKLKVPKNIILRYNNPDREIRKTVSIDKCLVKEIKSLWKLGIVTTGCCCGHKQHLPYIGVEDEYIETMKTMGYVVQTNPHGNSRQDTFYPKSIIIEPNMVESFLNHYLKVGLLEYKRKKE
jgi:hypothetical protein